MFLPRIGERAAATAQIEASGEAHGTVALDADDSLSVRGPLGETVVEIRDGRVRVVSSACRQKICVSMGPISRPGEMIVCVPNEVVIGIDGGRGGSREVDAVTR